MRRGARIVAAGVVLYAAISPAFAQVGALAQCSMRGVPGAGTGYSDVEAGRNAINNCVANGGVPGCCHVIATTAQIGSPCIAFAQRIGDTRAASVGGGESQEEAVGVALSYCGQSCTAVAAICGE
jgi:hypothetical protein